MEREPGLRTRVKDLSKIPLMSNASKYMCSMVMNLYVDYLMFQKINVAN